MGVASRIGALVLVVASALFGEAQSAHSQSADLSFGDPYRLLQRDGEAIYRAICQGCHMPDGQGAIGAGAYPPLANDPNLEASGYPIVLVLEGRRAMPPFGRTLDDGQIAAVVNYVRTHFGNHHTDVASAADVTSLRK
ncbi:MAG TPA: cytochrome c [Xanthobacteraceae bacterium]|nr:cytochrome c [Xanthobacteraceae bacterium]